VPDVLILRRRADFYADLPTPEDVLLLVEVSDTTLAYDQRRKVPLYSRNGIPEVWLADLGGQLIRVYREPSPTGYQVTFDRRRGEHLSPLAFPDLDLAVDDILG
jgi:Uma2 family endonuclease